MRTSRGPEASAGSGPVGDIIGKGVRIRVVDATGAVVLDARIPGGRYDKGTKTGWKSRAASAGATYLFVTQAPTAAMDGIVKVQLSYKRRDSSFRVSVSGKNGTYPVNVANLPLSATLSLEPPLATTGQCVEMLPAACKQIGGTVACL